MLLLMQGHGDVLGIDFARSDSLDHPDLDAETAWTSPPRTLPALFQRLALRKAGRASPAEGGTSL